MIRHVSCIIALNPLEDSCHVSLRRTKRSFHCSDLAGELYSKGTQVAMRDADLCDRPFEFSRKATISFLTRTTIMVSTIHGGGVLQFELASLDRTSSSGESGTKRLFSCYGTMINERTYLTSRTWSEHFYKGHVFA